MINAKGNAKEIKRRKEEGWIEGSCIIEAIGKPEKETEEFLEKHVSNIEKEEYCYLIEKEFFDGEKKEGLFTKVAEVHLLFKDVKSLLQFSLDFMPASIEIADREILDIKASDFNLFVNDMLAKLHDLNMMVRALDKQSKRLFSTQNALLKNIVFVSLREGSKNIEEISRDAGVDKEFMEKVLNALIKEEIVEKNGERYKLKPKRKAQAQD